MPARSVVPAAWAAARRTERRSLALGVGTLVAAGAWLLLVLAAIDFGRSARGGDRTAWGFLVVAGLGAVACLFVALLLALTLGQELRARRRRAASAPPGGGRHAGGQGKAGRAGERRD